MIHGIFSRLFPRSTAPVRAPSPVVVALSVIGISLAVGACFSERAPTDATPTGGAPCLAPATSAGSTIVFIRSFAFQTPTIHVKSGSSVTWVNCEPTNIPHTSTADAGTWDSNTLHPDASFVRSFTTTGTFTYHCAIHPSMKATVVVE